MATYYPKSWRRALKLFVLFPIAMTIASTAQAQDDFVLAKSAARKLSVVALGGSAWCNADLRLNMVLAPDSPDAANTAQLVHVMNKLKTPITAECRKAQSAEIKIIHMSKNLGTYTATATGGWQFSGTQNIAQPATNPQTNPQDSLTPQSLLKESEPQSSWVFPEETGYSSALLQYLKMNPEGLRDQVTLRWWASHRQPKEYNRVDSQEFQLQSLIDRTSPSLIEAVSTSENGIITITMNVRFEPYNFADSSFSIPISRGSLLLSRGCCTRGDGGISQFVVNIDGMEDLGRLPMDQERAKNFAAKRTSSWGSINRDLILAIKVRVSDDGFTAKEYGNSIGLSGKIESAAFFESPESLTKPIYVVTSEGLRTSREKRESAKAEADRIIEERKMELQRKQLLAQRDELVQRVSGQPMEIKLKNLGTPNTPEIFSDGLDNLYTMRKRAIVSGKAIDSTMLIQADGSGNTDVATEWPGHMLVTINPSAENLSSSKWYIVNGTFAIPREDSSENATFFAKSVYACEKKLCEEVNGAEAMIVDNKLGINKEGAISHVR